MATVTSKEMQDLGEFFKMVMEDAGLYPTRELSAAEGAGTVAALHAAVERLTPRARIGLLMVATAWGEAG